MDLYAYLKCAILTIPFGRRDVRYLLDAGYVCAIPSAIGSGATRERVRQGIAAGLKWSRETAAIQRRSYMP